MSSSMLLNIPIRLLDKEMHSFDQFHPPRLMNIVLSVIHFVLAHSACYTHFLVMVLWFLENLPQTIKPFDTETRKLKLVS